MDGVEGLLRKKVAELAGRRFAELQRIVEEPECCKESLDGRSYVFEIHGTKVGESVHLMVECARDLPLLRRFGRALYVAIAPDGTLTESSEPW